MSRGKRELIGLRLRWGVLCQRLGVTTAPDPSVLLERWSEPHRFYHTVRHLAACLEIYDRSPVHHPIIEAALWFHDAVYDPRASTNEVQSAHLVNHVFAGTTLTPSAAQAIGSAVLATAHHAPPANRNRSPKPCG